MYFDRRLWELTRGLRGRIALAIGLGVCASGFGIARVVFLGLLLAARLRRDGRGPSRAAGGGGRRGGAAAGIARPCAHRHRPRERHDRAGDPARQALRQDRRTGAGLVRRRAHRRRDAVGGRRRRAVAELFRPVRAAGLGRGADPDRDLRLYRVVGRAGRAGHAGRGAGDADRAGLVPRDRAAHRHGAAAGDEGVRLGIPRRRAGSADPEGVRAEHRLRQPAGRAGARSCPTRRCASCPRAS